MELLELLLPDSQQGIFNIVCLTVIAVFGKWTVAFLNDFKYTLLGDREKPSGLLQGLARDFTSLTVNLEQLVGEVKIVQDTVNTLSTKMEHLTDTVQKLKGIEHEQ